MRYNVGERIKKIRKEKGLKQQDIAEKCGLSRVAIVNYEKGNRKPSLNTIRIIAGALEVPLSELLVEPIEDKEKIELIEKTFKELDLTPVEVDDKEFKFNNKAIRILQKEADLETIILVLYLYNKEMGKSLEENGFTEEDVEPFTRMIADMIKNMTYTYKKNVIDVRDNKK